MDMTEPIGRGFAPSIRFRMHLYILAEPKSWDFSPIQSSLAIWAFPCPWARSGYILGVIAFATLAANLLERSLACASLRHTVVTIPNEIYLYKTTTNIQICSRFFKNFSTKFGISKRFPYFVEILP